MAQPEAQASRAEGTAGGLVLPGRWRFYGNVRAFLRDLSGEDQRFWVLVLATGALSGLGAVVLVEMLRIVQHLAWPPGASLLDAARASTPLRRVLVLTSGGILVAVVSMLMKRSLGGHGTAGIIEAIWRKEGRYSLSRALTNGAMAIVSVALGAPLGREGALISTGAGTGAYLARRLALSPTRTRILVACGASAGIAAAYNVPLGAALFGLEVLLGSFALELLGPIVVSCVVATVVSRVLVESHPAYVIPYYRLTGPSELLGTAVLALTLGCFSALYVRVIEWGADTGNRFQRYGPFLPVAAMLAVGLVAIPFPEILGNGYEAVNDSLLGNLPLRLLLLLPFLKMLATSGSSGAGVPGGLFTPSLYFGALLGGGLGSLLPGTSPSGAWALVGMVSVLAGTTHAAMSAVLIMFEMTRDYGLVLPLMLASVLSAAVSRRLEPLSLYTAVLHRRGVDVPLTGKLPWSEPVRVSALKLLPVATVFPDERFEKLVMRLLELPAGEDLYVTAADGSYLGVIVLEALKGNLPSRAHLDVVVAADVMQREPPPIPRDATLADAAAIGARTFLDRLPVVNAEGHLCGAISKGELMERATY